MSLTDRVEEALRKREDFLRKNGALNYSRIAAAISTHKPVTRQSVKAWCEGDVVSIRMEYLIAIAKETGVSLDWLLGKASEVHPTSNKAPSKLAELTARVLELSQNANRNLSPYDVGVTIAALAQQLNGDDVTDEEITSMLRMAELFSKTLT